MDFQVYDLSRRGLGERELSFSGVAMGLADESWFWDLCAVWTVMFVVVGTVLLICGSVIAYLWYIGNPKVTALVEQFREGVSDFFLRQGSIRVEDQQFDDEAFTIDDDEDFQ